MITPLFLIIGAFGGAMRAKKRGGNRLDMAQYGAIYGIIFGLVGLFISVYLARWG